MQTNEKLPGFSRVLSREHSILHDYYSLSSLIGVDMTFNTKNLDVSINADCPSIKKISSSCSFDINNRGFTTSLSVNNKSPPSISLSFPSQKLDLSTLSSSLFNDKSFIRSNLLLRYSYSKNSYSPSGTLSTAFNSNAFKGKLKLSNKRLAGNFTTGNASFGFGTKSSLNLSDFKVPNCSFVTWYKEDLANLKLNYLFYPSDRQKNRLDAYFFYQMFKDIGFAAKVSTNFSSENSLTAGWDAKLLEKGGFKLRVTSKGKIAMAHYNKILPRTKARIAFEVNLFDMTKNRFGTYFEFRAKSTPNVEKGEKVLQV